MYIIAILTKEASQPRKKPTKLLVGLERCQSGRMGLTANELTRETGSEGSNPSLSATFSSLLSLFRDFRQRDTRNKGNRLSMKFSSYLT